MNTTLTVIENFSDHYPELTDGVNLNIGGYSLLLAVGVIMLLVVVTVIVVAVWEKPWGYVKGFAIAIATVIAVVPMYVTTNDDAKVAAARFLTADRVTDAYDEMVAEVGDSERLAHRVSQDVHRFMPVGNAAIESREVVCGQGDNDRSLLCGGRSMTSIVYEVESHDDDSHDPLSLLVMTPNMEYHEDNDQVWVTVAVEFMAR